MSSKTGAAEHMLISQSAELEARDKRIAKLEGELRIKSEWISTRQCPDHSGKWPRGTCLQCEVEKQGSRLDKCQREIGLYRTSFNSLYQAISDLAKRFEVIPVDPAVEGRGLPKHTRVRCLTCDAETDWEPGAILVHEIGCADRRTETFAPAVEEQRPDCGHRLHHVDCETCPSPAVEGRGA